MAGLAVGPTRSRMTRTGHRRPAFADNRSLNFHKFCPRSPGHARVSLALHNIVSLATLADTLPRRVSVGFRLSFIDPYDRCPVCGSEALLDAGAIDIDPNNRIRWSRCSDCGLRFQNPRLSEASLHDLYAAADYFGTKGHDNPLAAYADFTRHDPVRIRQARRRLARIGKLSGIQTGRLLDVGSASGFFGVAAREAGFEVTCIEPDAAMAQYGRDCYGLLFLAAPLEACNLEPEAYDVVTAWGTESLFLHPLHSIERIVAALKPGGALALNYQDSRHWLRHVFPGLMTGWNVIYHHSNRSFDLMLARLGLTLVARELEWQTVSVDHICRVLRVQSFGRLRRLVLHVPAVSVPLVIARKSY
jgi:transcription elongation factor Elf1